MIKSSSRSQAIQLAVEATAVLLVVGFSVATLVLVPGLLDARPWILPAFVVASVSGFVGLGLRYWGKGRLAGIAYVLASLSPNGALVFNAILLGVAVAAICGVDLTRRTKHDSTHQLVS